mmetsp:Transcript_3111/g.7490  ORF Transcript_3111/g.7490 Transcript_3111/m.7490 type:complete len:265 (-) Transcript_3111:310-1104(-)
MWFPEQQAPPGIDEQQGGAGGNAGGGGGLLELQYAEEAPTTGGAAPQEEAQPNPVVQARHVWGQRGKKDALWERYGPLMHALDPYGRQIVKDALNMRSTSKKHICMHAELSYLLATGVIRHCNEHGVECPFGGGVRVEDEPRARGGQCAFGGWKGVKVVPERAEEFLSRWVDMHGMHICPDFFAAPPGDCPLPKCVQRREAGTELQSHSFGLVRRDWITLTENLSNHNEHKFGLVPLSAPGEASSWTNCFKGLNALVYRPISGP